MRTFLPLFFFSAIVYVNLDVADCKLVPVVPVRTCQGLMSGPASCPRTHVRTPTHAYKNLEPGVAPSCTHLGKRRKSVQKANVAWKTFLALLNELWLNFKGRGKQWNLAEIMLQFLMIRVVGSILSLSHALSFWPFNFNTLVLFPMHSINW